MRFVFARKSGFLKTFKWMLFHATIKIIRIKGFLFSVILLVLEEMSLCYAKTLNGFVVVVFDSGFSLFSRLLVYF